MIEAWELGFKSLKKWWQDGRESKRAQTTTPNGLIKPLFATNTLLLPSLNFYFSLALFSSSCSFLFLMSAGARQVMHNSAIPWQFVFQKWTWRFFSPLICLLPLHWTTISNLFAIGIRTTISNVFCDESFELWTKIPNQFCNLHHHTSQISFSNLLNYNFQPCLQLQWTAISHLFCNCIEDGFENCIAISGIFLKIYFCLSMFAFEPWLICATITTTVYFSQVVRGIKSKE